MSEHGARGGQRRIVRRREPVIGAAAPPPAPEPARGVQRLPAKPRRKHGAWRPLLTLGAIAILVMAAAGGGLYWMLNSQTFRIDTIEVAGTAFASPADVAAAAGLGGENLATADLNGALDRVLALPLVQGAEIERQWPHGIRITVYERQPWASWVQGGVSYTIDRDGVVMGTAIPAPADGPVIRSSEPGSRLPGDRVDGGAVRAAAAIYSDLPGRMGVEVSEVAFLAGSGVQVRTKDGELALLGDGSDLEYKLSAWAAMAREADARGIRYSAVDLRFGDRPVLVQ